MAEEKKTWIQPGISVGNIILLATLIASLALGWGRLETGLSSHDKRLAALEEADRALMADRMQEGRDMADMKADMRWIRITLERLERDLKARE